jgi:hypothetical protein
VRRHHQKRELVWSVRSPTIPDFYRFISPASWIQQKVADFSKPMMALFDNLIAADLKKGNNIMFIMVSSSHFQVAT